ncbi:hypothetical protein DERF_013153 [Dermatophagoides farinae]|uniref:Uncharacterized protein n=1 Tax=Dermatophagoides farinae TaxID=6954 RepID=A0A922HQM8_DERFA|nr:hypothetical protein DERF_013153 [Dermatophagoides farinae]
MYQETIQKTKIQQHDIDDDNNVIEKTLNESYIFRISSIVEKCDNFFFRKLDYNRMDMDSAFRWISFVPNSENVLLLFCGNNE